MLISCGSCEKPSHPGNYDASEICRSVAWSNTMILAARFFFQQSLLYSHCRLLNHYFGWWNREGLSSSSTGWSHCSAGVRPWRPGRDDLCCIFSHVVTQANYEHCGCKWECTSPLLPRPRPVFWPPKFTLLLRSFETINYERRHALFNNKEVSSGLKMTSQTRF